VHPKQNPGYAYALRVAREVRWVQMHLRARNNNIGDKIYGGKL